MSERETFSFKCRPEVAAAFRKMVEDTKGQLYGELGREAENALIEYMDNDRYQRIEENQKEILARLDSMGGAPSGESGSHTHKGHATPTTVTEKAELIASRLREQADTTIHGDRVDKAIRKVAGADDRTIAKYREELRAEQYAFAHPANESNVWFLDGSVWANVVENYVSNTPDATLIDVISPYGMDIEAYEELLPADKVDL